MSSEVITTVCGGEEMAGGRCGRCDGWYWTWVGAGDGDEMTGHIGFGAKRGLSYAERRNGEQNKKRMSFAALIADRSQKAFTST